MVTATILGCANKVRKAMQLKIANINDYNSDYLTDMYLINSMNRDLTRTINSAVNSSINTANYTISAAESSNSSSGGFGGGSSFGGGRRRPEAAEEAVSKKDVSDYYHLHLFCNIFALNLQVFFHKNTWNNCRILLW